MNQPGLLGEREECVRRNDPAIGLEPPHQGFSTGHPPAGQIDFWLIRDLQLLLLQGQAQATHRRFVHRPGEKCIAAAVCPLGTVLGQLGVLDQGRPVAAIGGEESEAITTDAGQSILLATAAVHPLRLFLQTEIEDVPGMLLTCLKSSRSRKSTASCWPCRRA